MQRWILAGGLVLILIFSGGIYAYSQYKQSRPHPVWVPMQINHELPDHKRLEIITQLKAGLQTDEVLLAVSKDLKLPVKLDLPGDKEAAAEIRKRLFVDLGEAETPMGRVPSVNIGVKGVARDKDVSTEIATRLMQDVIKILGIKPPPPQEL